LLALCSNNAILPQFHSFYEGLTSTTEKAEESDDESLLVIAFEEKQDFSVCS